MRISSRRQRASSVAGCSNRSIQQGRSRVGALEAYPLGYVAGDGRLRTTLGGYFSILLGFGAAEAQYNYSACPEAA